MTARGKEPTAECLRVRDLFLSALDDPIVENEILAHAQGCLECLDAYHELKETVSELTLAGDALPDTGTFASSVFDAIDREQERRKGARLTLILLTLGAFLAGIGMTVLGLHFLKDAPEPRSERQPADWRDFLPEEDRDPGSGRGPDDSGSHGEPGTGEEQPSFFPDISTPDSNSGKAVPDKPLSAEEVENRARAFVDEVLGARESGEFGGPGRGRRFRMVRTIIEKARSLPKPVLKRAVEMLEKHGPSDTKAPVDRFLQEMIDRLKSMLDQGLGKKGHGKAGFGGKKF